MSLYNCKSTSTRETYRITKFGPDFNIESSYLVGAKTCECPQHAKRSFCRHATIRAMFMTSGHIDDEWMLDFDTRQWTRNPAVANLDATTARIVADELTLGRPKVNGCAGGPVLPLDERSEGYSQQDPYLFSEANAEAIKHIRERIERDKRKLGAGGSASPAPPPEVERPRAPSGGLLRGRKL